MGKMIHEPERSGGITTLPLRVRLLTFGHALLIFGRDVLRHGEPTHSTGEALAEVVMKRDRARLTREIARADNRIRNSEGFW